MSVVACTCDEVVKQRVVPWTWSLLYGADVMTGVSPTSTSESKVCKVRPGQSALTTTGNSRSSSARSARYWTRSRRRCLRLRPRDRSRVNSTTRTSRALRAAKTTPSTPASAPASITRESGGNNGIEKAIAEEP